MPEGSDHPSNKPVKQREETDDSLAHSNINDVLVRLASKGPLWLRALGVVVALLTAATPYLSWLREYIDEESLTRSLRSTSIAVASEPVKTTPYTGGTPVKPPPDQSEEAAVLDAEDARHLSWHTVNKEENPGFKRIPVSDKKGILAYSVYTSDGCILIKHVKAGHIKNDLVRAEQISKKLPQTSGPGSISLDPTSIAIPPSLLHIAMKEKETPAGSSHGEKTDIDLLQGSCMNPHPGTFNYWNGQALNQCVLPVFRRFGDGCVHYQFFNHCTSSWDPEIHWTFCNAYHPY